MVLGGLLLRLVLHAGLFNILLNDLGEGVNRVLKEIPRAS